MGHDVVGRSFVDFRVQSGGNINLQLGLLLLCPLLGLRGRSAHDHIVILSAGQYKTPHTRWCGVQLFSKDYINITC